MQLQTKLFIFFGIFFCGTSLYAQLMVEKKDSGQFFSSQLTLEEAGNDIESEIETPSDAVHLSVNFMPNTLDNSMYRTWYITVHKEDVVWNTALELLSRRTANGSNAYGTQLQQGLEYQELGLLPTFFFSGQGGFNQIPIQFKLSGLSVTLPAQRYATEIVFTLWEE